jgi:WD40 repeat protein
MLFLGGHEATARYLAFSADGGLLTSAADMGKEIALWDAVSGRPRGSLTGHAQPISALAFSGRGVLASVDWRGEVRLWDPASGRLLSAPRRLPAAFPTCLTFSPDGRYLAAGVCRRSSYAVLRLEVSTEAALPDLAGRDQMVYCVAFSPDGRTLAAGTEEGVYVWDLAGPRLRATLRRQAAGRAAAFTPAGDTLAVAQGGGVTLWEPDSGRTRAALRGQEGLVTCVALGPCGEFLLTGAWGGAVRLWAVTSGRHLAVYDWRIGRVSAVAVSPDGMRAAASGHRGIVIWDLDV